jgi:hypothetical protein
LAYAQLKANAQVSSASQARKGKRKSRQAEGLFKQVYKTIQLLSSNPRHPGLQTHEYYSLPHPHDPKGKVFEAYAQNRTPGAYRVFWCYGPGAKQITIIAITPHP